MTPIRALLLALVAPVLGCDPGQRDGGGPLPPAPVVAAPFLSEPSAAIGAAYVDRRVFVHVQDTNRWQVCECKPGRR